MASVKKSLDIVYMNASFLRESFIKYFKDREHTVVQSESLMPSSPNLLFTNAGMNQFVPYFLGDRPAPYPRAVDTQKCIRAGGKHNDLEDVGFDTYHHTFFEMLGNWSFGDYFKKEAIHWAWELLTVQWKFPKNRLYVTVYKPSSGDPASFDQEAYDIWKNILVKEGLDPNIHIVYGNKKDNFWMMGETGPCGPCSEIHIDLTEKGDSKGALVNNDSPYCIEIWNLVFIQFNAEQDGSFRTLTSQHVDTGMGFERVAGIIATTKNFTDFTGAPSNYNSDLFAGIFKKIAEMSGLKYTATIPKDRHNLTAQELIDCSFRVLADHIRTLSFSIADGILPGNEGRNYVLRRILRRAILFGNHLKLQHGFFTELIQPVIDQFGEVFPELAKNAQLIHKVIASEESAFDRTLERGLALLDKITKDGKEVSGKDAFTLYDTYGFPIDLTQLIANERHLKLDIEGFNHAMEEQRERARASQKKTVISVAEDGDHGNQTKFVGYDRENLIDYVATLKNIMHSEKKTFLVFDSTPFYPNMGGQVGDTGTIKINGHVYHVVDTVKDASGQILHQVSSAPNESAVGQQAILTVTEDRRFAIQRHHSATHLLHWALRKVLGTHVKQAGSLVDPERLRFDFSHFEAPTAEQLAHIERLVNEAILLNAKIQTNEMAFDEKPENCIAFFGEKYGKIVRVVDIGGYSVELCGGTHVEAVGEIGFIKISAESAIAAGTRRIEAIAGLPALNLIESSFSQLSKVASLLACKPSDVESRMNAFMEAHAGLEKELRKFQQQSIDALAKKLAKHAKPHDGLHWVIEVVAVSNPNDLRPLAVNIAQQIEPSVVILAAAFEDKVNILALCDKKAIDKGYAAGEMVSKLTAQLDGKGGGKPDFAMGGAKNSPKLQEILHNFAPFLQHTS